jgi:ankyrin repeat protein
MTENGGLSQVTVYASDGRWDDIQEILSQFSRSQVSEAEIALVLCELCYYGKIQSIQQLLNAGADPNYRYSGDEESSVVYRLVAYPRTTPLGQTILGCSERHYDTKVVMERLLDCGADPNMHTYAGYTPLQLTILNDCPEHARVLLSRGADPYKLYDDVEPSDAFDVAREEGCAWGAKLLSEVGQ